MIVDMYLGADDMRPSVPTFSEDSRVLALDWGQKRVGVAISDPLGITAQGLTTMSRRNHQKDLNYLRSLVVKHRVSLVILGNPLQMNGSEGTQADKMKAVKKDLEENLEREVRLWDERLTSMEAHRVLSEAGVSQATRGQAVDRMAAVLLLQNFLDSQPRPERERGEPVEGGE
jgi:putative Holliday junction resolvase